MTLRIAQPHDLPRIVEIYNSTIPGRQSTADLEPVSVNDRQAWFDRHRADSYPLLVEENDAGIIAWISFEPFYGRAAYRRTAELSIYVASDQRGQGLGSRLLAEALEHAVTLRFRNIVGYVFAHNPASLALMRRFGFEEWGHLPDVAEMDGKPYSLCIVGKRLEQL